MKPSVESVLQKLAANMLLEVGPALPAGYVQSSMGVTAMLLQCASEEFDRAAARLVEENAALRALFGDAIEGVEEAMLREQLEVAAGGADPGLHVSELEGANAQLRGLLIALHAHVEERSDPAARQIESAIWQELRASTERRRLSVAPF